MGCAGGYSVLPKQVGRVRATGLQSQSTVSQEPAKTDKVGLRVVWLLPEKALWGSERGPPWELERGDGFARTMGRWRRALWSIYLQVQHGDLRDSDTVGQGLRSDLEPLEERGPNSPRAVPLHPPPPRALPLLSLHYSLPPGMWPFFCPSATQD